MVRARHISDLPHFSMQAEPLDPHIVQPPGFLGGVVGEVRRRRKVLRRESYSVSEHPGQDALSPPRAPLCLLLLLGVVRGAELLIGVHSHDGSFGGHGRAFPPLRHKG